MYLSRLSSPLVCLCAVLARVQFIDIYLFVRRARTFYLPSEVFK